MRISDWSSDVCSSDLRLIASGEDYGTHLLPAIARPSLFGMAHTSRTQGGTDRAARCHRPLAGDGREGDIAGFRDGRLQGQVPGHLPRRAVVAPRKIGRAHV